jgi:hypothetical protein
MRRSWFDPDNTLSFQQYYQHLESWQQALADGRVDASEVEAQARRVADLLREIEPTLTDAQHARLTDVFGEMAVLQAMQQSLVQVQERQTGQTYVCPNADLDALSAMIADRFRAQDLEVERQNELGTWVVRTQKKDGWRMAFGLVYDVAVRLTPAPGGFEAKLDFGDWTDKIISGALTLIGAWPWLITGGVGLYQEYQFLQEARETIESYVTSRGGQLPGK